MKKVLLGVVVLLVSVWIYAAFVGIEPKDRRAGTRLSGDAVALPESWTFLQDPAIAEVHLETQPWFGVPFSVTTVITEAGGNPYLPSLYDDVMVFPGSKYWNKVVAANPQVRLRVAGSLYEMAIYPVTDPVEFERAFRALGKKYPFWAKKVAANETQHQFALLRLQPRMQPR